VDMALIAVQFMTFVQHIVVPRGEDLRGMAH